MNDTNGSYKLTDGRLYWIIGPGHYRPTWLYCCCSSERHPIIDADWSRVNAVSPEEVAIGIDLAQNRDQTGYFDPSGATQNV